MRRFDLRSLRFDDTGEAWRRLPVEVSLFVLGGLEYEVAGGVVEVDLTAGRVGDNLTLTLEFEAELEGPCQRCLGAADVRVAARGVEYAQHGESEGDDDTEAYVVAYSVDMERWVRDLVAESLPAKLLCRDDCRGLCPVCGADLNAEPDHGHAEA